MKIMFVIGAFSYGGAERVMTNLVNRFALNNDIIYVGVQRREKPAYEIAPNVIVINGIGYKRKSQAIKYLRKIIKENKPNAIISFLPRVNVITLLASLRLNIPVVISERNAPSRNAGRILDIVRKIVYPRAAGVVFQTKEAQEYFSKEIRDKSTIIPNPVFISDDNKEYISQKRKKEICAVGRLEKQKNYPLLINAFSVFSKQHPEYCLKIYGEGREKSNLLKIIKDNNMEKKIELCGTCHDVHEHIKDSEVYVLSSEFEGMPNSLMEAMALGLCCISSDCPVGGPRELIVDGVNGFLFENGNVNQLVDKMRYCVSDSKKYERITVQAKKIIERLDLDLICRQWMNYITTTLQ